MSADDFCGLDEIARETALPIETVRDYAQRGWFDKQDGSTDRYCRGDSIWRCGLISHLRKDMRFSDEEVGGAIDYMMTTRTARMGGGLVKERYVPFEQELGKAGPLWICVGLGEHSPDEPIRFTVHGRIQPEDLEFIVVRSDAVLARRGKVTLFKLLDRTYARGQVDAGLREGTYRIHLGGCGSYPFRVSRNASVSFINLGLRYFRGTRCGEATEFHPACHRDDGLRSDTGAYYPLVGGWHDAGDFCHITSTTTASYYLAKALEATDAQQSYREALYQEAMHGADYNLRARDPVTGQVFENKGVGRGGLDGKFGDNGRTTDNIVLSGDERAIRTTGSIETAMDCLSALALMARQYQGKAPIPQACIDAAEKSWTFHEKQEPARISHLAKRVICAVEWHVTTGDSKWLKRAPLAALCAAVDQDGDVRDLNGRIFLEHYQHGAPLLALALAAQSETELAAPARETAERIASRLVQLAALQPYGVTCYALALDEHIPEHVNQDTLNRWHPLSHGKSYRMYQPFTSRFWQGSVSQLSVLGIGLTMLGRTLNNEAYIELARRHWDWSVGANPYQCCMVSGWGACEPSPQSGAVGYMPGGTCQGPIGDQNDEPYMQVGLGMRMGEEPLFNIGGPSYAREYWSPLSGALIWLRTLLSAR